MNKIRELAENAWIITSMVGCILTIGAYPSGSIIWFMMHFIDPMTFSIPTLIYSFILVMHSMTGMIMLTTGK